MERAVHGLEVIVDPLTGDLPRLIALLVNVHRRKHSLPIPGEMSAHVKKIRLGNVGGVDKLVPGLFVSFARIVLHDPANNTAFGVEYRKARANLVREAEQVKLDPELPVVTALCLFQAGEVLGELLFARPGGAVNALKLRVSLFSPPIGRGHTSEVKTIADELGVWQVRAPTQVRPHGLAGLRIDIVIDCEFTRAHFDTFVIRTRFGLGLQPNEFQLVRLSCQLGTCLIVRHHTTNETLTLVDDALHVFGKTL